MSIATYSRKREANRLAHGEALAQAVLAFAEWQEQGYGASPDQKTREEISSQLWSEVSEHVYYFTNSRPALPRARPDGDERDDYRSAGG